jgi:hypothetical protein
MNALGEFFDDDTIMIETMIIFLFLLEGSMEDNV